MEEKNVKSLIRIERIELINFKNIQKGVIEFHHYRNKLFYTHEADVIGIYGQNGSGKTAVIEALDLCKRAMSSEPFCDGVENYINKNANEATLKFVFYVETKQKEKQRCLMFYEFSIEKYPNKLKNINLAKANQFLARISNEKLSYIPIGKRNKTDILSYHRSDMEQGIRPKLRYSKLTRHAEDKITVEIAKRSSIKEVRSFIFHPDIIAAFDHVKEEEYQEYTYLLRLLSYYAKMNLFVITNHFISTMNLKFLPLCFRLEDERHITSGEIGVSLIGTSTIPLPTFELVHQVVHQLNMVLQCILPGLTLEIRDLGKELGAYGEEQQRIELVAVKGEIKIPLKYESDGIKKIISILSTMISMFYNPSVCLVVDELDSGIYEYLLGELLYVLEQHGMGQLVFTSHNLRPLEKLRRDSIIISTTNPTNRFIRLPSSRDIHNLRSAYLRGIDLGGLDECIYEPTNRYEIIYAFQKAGEFIEAK